MAERRLVPRPPGTPVGGGDPLTATGQPLRWGVAATGKIAGVVTAQLALLEDASLQAVSSRDPAKAAAFATRFGFSSSYGNEHGELGYERLALDPTVDVVYVATPHGQHHAVAMAMLTAGKHVLIEKAFTINAREAHELVALAAANGLFLMEAVWTRFLPVYHRVLDVIEQGAIGKVVYVQADLGFMAARDPRDRLWAPIDGGGALLDLAVYPLSWVLGALGRPRAISATGRLNAEGVDELSALAMTHEHGAYSQVVASFVSESVNRAAIVGDAGVIVTDTPVSRPTGFTITTGGASRHEDVPHGPEPYTYQLREVTRCIQQGLRESPTMPLAATLSTMELFDEVRRQTGVTYPNDYPEQ